jgi:hypothetical protein
VFNQKIKNFPINLKKIIFGYSFNNPLDYLPDGLEELEFVINSHFDHDLSNLPTSLKRITIGYKFSKSLDCLPKKLEYLKIPFSYDGEIKIFPQELKHLYFYNSNKYSTDKKYEHEIKNLPDNLIEIRYPPHYSHQITTIPKSLKIISISNNYKFINELKKMFPEIKINCF